MNLSFINVITGNTKILEILNNTPSEDRAELCLNSIVPHLNIESDEIYYSIGLSRVTYVDIIELNENNLVLDVECEIVVGHDEEGEDVIPKIKDFEKINGDIRNFVRTFWIDKEIKKPILFDGWDVDEFAEQLEEEISWFEPDEENLGNTLKYYYCIESIFNCKECCLISKKLLIL